MPKKYTYPKMNPIETYTGNDPLNFVIENGFYSFEYIVNEKFKVTAQHGEDKRLFCREILSGSFEKGYLNLGEQKIFDADEIDKITNYSVEGRIV